MRFGNLQEVFVPEGKEDLDIYVEGGAVIKDNIPKGNLIAILGVALVVKYVAIFVEQSLYL